MVINHVFKFHRFQFTFTKVRVRKPNVFGRRRRQRDTNMRPKNFQLIKIEIRTYFFSFKHGLLKILIAIRPCVHLAVLAALAHVQIMSDF